MSDFSDADRDKAREIINRLHEGEDYFPEGESGLSVEDIENDFIEFSNEASLVEMYTGQFPVLEVKGGAKIPVSLYHSIAKNIIGRHLLLDEFLFSGPAFLRRYDAQYTLIPVKKARENFKKLATDFLAERISALRHRREKEDKRMDSELHMNLSRGGTSSTVPGCQFSVITKSSGLSTYWSGAYYINPNYHKAPTSPATAPLQAGTYVFGVNGGAYGSRVRWDKNKVCTIPGCNSVTLPY